MHPDRRQRSFLNPGVLGRLAGLSLFARRSMQGNVSGRHPSPHRGASVEFAEYRKYVPGDDLRRLDWRAYGRTDRFYVKEFEADTNLRCCLVMDTSGSMGFGSGETTKLEYARQIAGTLAYLAIRQGDAVGLSCVAERVVREIPARRNPGHLMHLYDAMEGAEANGPTRLVEVLHEIAETIRQRALMVIVSDLFVPPDSLRACFEHLRFRKHDVAVFHLLDPQELEFRFQRPTRFLDMEGGEAVFAEPNAIADRYRQALTEYLDAVNLLAQEQAIDYHRVRTDEMPEQALTRFLVGRQKTRGVR